MPETPAPAPPPPGTGRLTGLDAFRGLILALMALDHASSLLAGIHRSEMWSKPLPAYDAALSFLTRFVTHLCAPGFFLLLGAGLVFFSASRARAGWTPGRTARTLALRGLILMALQFLVENPAWGLPGGHGPSFVPYFGVLYGLGASLFFWSALLRLPGPAVLGLSLAAMAASWTLVPWLGATGGDTPAWLAVIGVPGSSAGIYVLYPLVPWLGVVGLGICLGRLFAGREAQTRAALGPLGLVLLAAFVLLRLAGLGDFHPPASPDWKAFLNVTKYPPSLDFLLLTLGLDAFLLRFFMAPPAWAAFLAARLAVFGQSSLFFYVTHLYLFALLGLALPGQPSLAGVYPFWLAGLLLLYPLCARYGRFKRTRPPQSPWRLF